MRAKRTFYRKRTHSITREHILSQEDTFYHKRTHSITREHILSQENAFYDKRTHSIVSDRCVRAPPPPRECPPILSILSSENTFYRQRTHSIVSDTCMPASQPLLLLPTCPFSALAARCNERTEHDSAVLDVCKRTHFMVREHILW